MQFNFNSEFTKYLLLALTFQWWFPFLKAIWDDFNDALRDEGGILGMAPTRSKLEELDRELGEYQTTLRSEPRPLAGAGFGRGPGASGASGASGGPGTAGPKPRGAASARPAQGPSGAKPAPRRPGFR